MSPYDAIVVGARCAGSPTAMLLARNGYKVLLVDRATFPSGTISTHLIHPPGVRALKKWGLLDRLIAIGCPAIHTYAFDMGPFVITGRPGLDDSPVSYGPRRTVLDKLLVDAAADAGAELREGFTVEEVLTENGRVTGVRGHAMGGRSVTERARVVVGADGLHSSVAQTVRPDQYHEKPQLQAGYYTYWSGGYPLAFATVPVLDIGLPGDDGYSLIRQVRAREAGARPMPAVAVSAFARGEDRDEALEAGFQLHVAKPVRPVELVTAVAGLVGER